MNSKKRLELYQNPNLIVNPLYPHVKRTALELRANLHKMEKDNRGKVVADHELTWDVAKCITNATEVLLDIHGDSKLDDERILENLFEELMNDEQRNFYKELRSFNSWKVVNQIELRSHVSGFQCFTKQQI